MTPTLRTKVRALLPDHLEHEVTDDHIDDACAALLPPPRDIAGELLRRARWANRRGDDL